MNHIPITESYLKDLLLEALRAMKQLPNTTEDEYNAFRKHINEAAGVLARRVPCAALPATKEEVAELLHVDAVIKPDKRPSACNLSLMDVGKPYPRTCKVCHFAKCPYANDGD